jgi:hypothetical protein
MYVSFERHSLKGAEREKGGLKMKKLLFAGFTFVFVLTLSFGMANALTSANGKKLSGPHYQFNLIGHPKSISGDYSNGRAIMIPLKTTNNDPLPCDDFADGVEVTDHEAPAFEHNYTAPKGVKLVFTPAQDFAIVDRDGTDGDAEVEIAIVDPNSDDPDDRVLAVDVYLRILGKPNQCMRIDGYADDATQSLWFWSGRVDLKRKVGQSTFVKVNELFNVWWCEVDDGGSCVAGTEVELSVFDSSFTNYFWDIQNKAVRNVQVRLYPVTSP